MEKIKKGAQGAVLFLAVMLFGVTLSFAEDHYVINGSSSVTNQDYTGFNQTQNAYHGGVFYVQTGGALTVNSSKIHDNSVSIINGSYGGAIYNDGELNVYESEIFSNRASIGGAIYNDENGKITIGTGVTVSSNSTRNQGGAIFNKGDMTISSNVSFISNKAEFLQNTPSTNSHGGAIYNEGNIVIGDNVKFSSNSVRRGGLGYTNGGAIYNNFNALMEIGENAEFSNNSTHLGLGGAIINFSTMTIKSGAKFINNSIGVVGGGAIDNAIGMMNLIADTADIEFTGNTSAGVSNAINASNGTVNLWTSDDASIIFNDRITSFYAFDDYSYEPIININQSSGTLPTTGKVILNEDMTDYKGQVNIYSGMIELGEKGTLFGGTTFIDNVTMDFSKAIMQNYNFNDLNVNDTLNLIVKADLENEQMDTISADSFSGGGKINVNVINITNDAHKKNTDILFTTSTVLFDKITSTTTAYSQLYKYDVLYNNNGYFTFIDERNYDINPIPFAGAVASAVGGFTTQKIITDQAFASLDDKVFIKKQNKSRDKNTSSVQHSRLYASTANQVFENNNKIENGLWIRPYMVQDTIKLGETDVDNKIYGTLAGIDLPVDDTKQVSFYIGYAQSKQDFKGMDINQTGYIAGTSAMLIKDKYYVGLTANVNINKAETDTDFGTDEFDMNIYGVGAKAGYNAALGKNWGLEPSLMLLYVNVSRQEYDTKQGYKIRKQSDNSLVIEPQLKVKLDLKGGYQPYVLAGYVINAGENPKVDEQMQNLGTDKIDGYVEYGIGLNKEFINAPWSCYVQVTGKGGDRNGFDGRFGIKYGF